MVCKSFCTTTIGKWERGRGEHVAFVRYKEVTTPLHAVENNLSCVCESWIIFDEMDHIFRGGNLEHRLVRVEERYRLENMSSIFWKAHIVRRTPAVHPFLQNCHGVPIGFS